MSRRRMLIDATPLVGESGFRGIGKYVRDLLQGLDETRDEWRDELDIKAATFSLSERSLVVSSELTHTADTAFAMRGTLSSIQLARGRSSAFASLPPADYDLLHFTEAGGLPARLRKPYVVTCHDLVPLRMPKHYDGSFGRSILFKRTCRRYYGRAERVIAISERTSDDVQELLGISASKVDIIRHGLSLQHAPFDLSSDRAILHELGLGAATYLIYAGYSDFRKNVAGMIAALAQARKSLDVVLAWAGSLPESQQRRILKLAAQQGVGESVKLLGFIPDAHLAVLYRNALAHLFISRLEGFGYSVAEAMSAGCPVIVAKGSGSDELAATAGLHVDADDAQTTGNCIAQLSRCPELRETLSAQGMQRARQFSRRDMARGYVETYLNALRNTVGPDR